MESALRGGTRPNESPFRPSISTKDRLARLQKINEGAHCCLTFATRESGREASQEADGLKGQEAAARTSDTVLHP
jgi:hypothetical protein